MHKTCVSKGKLINLESKDSLNIFIRILKLLGTALYIFQTKIWDTMSLSFAHKTKDKGTLWVPWN